MVPPRPHELRAVPHDLLQRSAIRNPPGSILLKGERLDNVRSLLVQVNTIRLALEIIPHLHFWRMIRFFGTLRSSNLCAKSIHQLLLSRRDCASCPY